MRVHKVVVVIVPALFWAGLAFVLLTHFMFREILEYRMLMLTAYVLMAESGIGSVLLSLFVDQTEYKDKLSPKKQRTDSVASEELREILMLTQNMDEHKKSS